MKRRALNTEPSKSRHVAPSRRQDMPLPRAQHSSERSYFKGNLSSLSADEALSSKAAKVEWMWQLERDSIAPSAALTSFPSRDEVLFHDISSGASVVASNGTKPYFHGQTAPGLSHAEEQARRETSAQPHEQDMEIGYEDDRPSLTLRSLEQKFFEEVMQLVKEQNDAADAESTRHRERIIEINNHYRDKLSSLRGQQANRRKEFLLREQREHLVQQQEVPPAMVPNMTFQAQGSQEIESIPQRLEVAMIGLVPKMTFQAQDAREIEPIPFTSVSRESLVHHTYSTGMHDVDGNRSCYPTSRGAQTRETEERVPLPAGRVYNTSSRYQ